MEKFIDPQTRPWKTAFAFALAALAVILTLRAQSVLLLAYLAVLLGVLLDAITEFEIHWLKMRRGPAVVLAAMLFLLGLGGLLVLLAFPLLKQGEELVQAMPEKTHRISMEMERYRQQYPLLEHVLPATDPPASPDPGPKPTEAAKTAIITASSALEWGARGLATFFLALFLAWNPERWIRGMAELGRRDAVERRIGLFRRIAAGLRSYLVSMGVYMVAMAALWTGGLWVIGIDYPILFGVIGGLAEIVPYLGPLVGLIPPLLYALTLSGMKAIYVVLLYLLLHIIEGYILVPYLMHERERLPPPLVVLSILIAGSLFGFLGVLLAVPLGTTVYVWLKETVYLPRMAENSGK